MAKQKLKELLIDTMKFLGEKHKELASVAKAIAGDGSPEGRVTAEKGTVYTDNQITLGVSQWIKTTPNGNTGWKVLNGDTGWVEITRATNRLNGSNKVWIRRINDRVTWKFGGAQFDWFGIIGPENPSWQGNPNRTTYMNLKKSGQEKVIHSYICVPNWNVIPVGFRSPSSLIGQFYSDLTNKAYGVWKLGGVNDKNQFRFEFFDQADAKKDINDIRVDTVTYLTDDPWPTSLTA